jgi:hypothetical protein
MLDNVLIPHDAIQAFANGNDQPTKLVRVQPLFSLKEASRILGMEREEVSGLLRTKRLFGVLRR